MQLDQVHIDADLTRTDQIATGRDRIQSPASSRKHHLHNRNEHNRPQALPINIIVQYTIPEYSDIWRGDRIGIIMPSIERRAMLIKGITQAIS